MKSLGGERRGQGIGGDLVGRLLLALLFAGTGGYAADLSGNALVTATRTDTGTGTDSESLEQNYGLSLFQELAPYLNLSLSYDYRDFGITPTGLPEISRRTREPLLQLNYNRDRLAARFGVSERKTDGTSPADNFDVESLFASISWESLKGFGFGANYRDESNVADPSVFGRNTDTTVLNLDAYFERTYWRIQYAYQRNDLSDQTSGLESDQERHGVRFGASRRLAGDRLRLSFSALADDMERRSKVPVDGEFLDPVPATDGLFAVDTTPEIGELASAPALVDGDVDTPAAPGIDIGGGNTFRNIGLDLGFIVPLTNVEISVDEISDGGLQWEVYRSSDNLLWERVDIVSSRFDGVLLRYELRFERIESRFVKAVNVSVNGQPTVRVTEMRALLARQVSAADETIESNLYRVDLGADFRPTQRVSGSVSAGSSNDEALSDGFVRRDYSVVYAAAGLSFDLAANLDLSMNYRYEDSEELRDVLLLRTLESYGMALRWNPLPTVDTTLTYQEREESEANELLQADRSARLRAAFQLVPELRLVTDAVLTRTEDPTVTFDREGVYLAQTIEATPTTNWDLRVRYAYRRNDTYDRGTVLERQDLEVWTTWNATHFLTLHGTWFFGLEGSNDNLRQNYGLTYTPGPKLTVTASYQDFRTVGQRSTSSDSLSLSYWISRNSSLFAGLSRSRFSDNAGAGDTTSLRAGLRLAF